MKNPEYVELYVCDELRQVLTERTKELVGVNHRMYVNKLLYILSKIHYKQVHHSTDYEKNGAKLRIFVNQLQRKTNPEAEKGTLVYQFSSSSKKVTNMVNTLVAWGVIQRKHEHVIGVSARTYQFTERFANCQAGLQRFYLEDGAFVRKLLQKKAEQSDHPVLSAVLKTYQDHVTLSSECLAFIKDQYHECAPVLALVEAYQNGYFEDNREALLKAVAEVRIHPEHSKLLKLLKKEYYASVGPQNGRIDHNLTNLERKFRRYVLIGGKPMVETDIANCQPALATGLIKQQLKQMHGEDYMTEDLFAYEDACRKGLFYELVAERAGLPYQTPEQRNSFKQDKFFTEMYFCRNNNWNTKTQVAFRELFPSADAAIRELKKKNHKQFSIQLQKMESEVVVYDVFMRLFQEGYAILPLHDAIYTYTDEVRQYAQSLIRESLRSKFGVEVSFKDELVHQRSVEVEKVITQEQAFQYFENRVDRYIEFWQERDIMGERFRRPIILNVLRNEIQRDHRIPLPQKDQLYRHLKEFDQGRLSALPAAA